MKDINATIIIDIHNKEEEDVWKNMEHSRRKNVKKAKESGLIFREALSERDIEESHKIYSRVWFEGGVESVPYEEWRRIVNLENSKLFVTEYENKIIGSGLIEFITGDFYGGAIAGDKKGIKFYAFSSNKEYNDFRPNDFLYWSFILYALNRSYDFVDLGGWQMKARDHLMGVNAFKEKWGGKITYYYHEYPPYKAIGRKLIRNFRVFWWLNKKMKGRR